MQNLGKPEELYRSLFNYIRGFRFRILIQIAVIVYSSRIGDPLRSNPARSGSHIAHYIVRRLWPMRFRKSMGE